jgi:hypothetical protein
MRQGNAKAEPSARLTGAMPLRQPIDSKSGQCTPKPCVFLSGADETPLSTDADGPQRQPFTVTVNR